MPERNGTWKWIVGSTIGLATLFLTLALTLRGADLRSIDRYIAVAGVKEMVSEARNAAQDSSIARLNAATALDRQEWRNLLRAISTNQQLILDALDVPRWKRATIDTTASALQKGR
jgi:hypothetical protein